MRQRTAIHEAGHAVMSFIEGYEPNEISIVPTDETLGHALGANPMFETSPDVDYDEEFKDQAFSAAKISLAGIAAEMNLLGDTLNNDVGCGDDIRKALNLVSYYVGSNEQLQKTVDSLFEEVRETLAKDHCATAVQSLADAVIRKKTLSTVEILAIIKPVLGDASI